MTDEIPWLSAVEIAARVRDGDLSPVDVVETFLSRIERRNPDTNAYVTVCADRAREAARDAERAVEAGEELGPLHGVPVAIKDLNRVEGVRTTFGSHAFADHVPDESDTAVERLEDAGAIVLGKTNTPEFGRKTVTDNPLFGATANPWDVDRTTGGSSGGNAAALADGLAPIALGGDAAGSLRIPASACGVVGFMPDFGRVPFGPVRDDAFLTHQPYSYNGPMARTVEDAALMLSVIAGPDDADPYSLPGPVPAYADADATPTSDLRVAYTPDFGVCTVTDEVRDVVEDALGAFEDRGAAVERLDSVFDQSWETLHDALNVLLQTRYVGLADGFEENHGIDLFDLDDPVTPEVLSRIERGRDLSVADYQRAQRVRTRASDAVGAVFDSYDLLVAPTLSIPPFDKDVYPARVAGEAVDPLHGWILTWPINLTGNPTLAVPAGFSDGGLPVGLQLVGPRHDDAAVLAAGRAYEAANPWAGEYPPR
jgi:Asp-tRNA(Asn)/Glu-tRNA(Gln) amidotransferase A subunit family amidase